MDFPSMFVVPQRTHFSRGAIRKLAQEVRMFGTRGIVVHGHSLEKSGKLAAICATFPKDMQIATVCRSSGEPTLADISEVIVRAREHAAAWIAGIGGGSVLDLAKAAAGLLNAVHEPAYYQEGGELEQSGIPFIAVPTTAGSGAECTPNAVIIDSGNKTKRSIRDLRFMAQAVILDSALMDTLPPTELCYSGLDAFVQAYESYVSKHATWLSDTFALKALTLINNHLVDAVDGGRPELRESLLLGSYCAGIALANARLGVIHGIAHPLGVLYNEPHGLICAVSLVPSVKLNRKSIGAKYEKLSETVGMDFLARCEELIQRLRIHSPFAGAVCIEKEKIIHETLTSGSTAANPKPIERADVMSMLDGIFTPLQKCN